jgi:hypothetical protein
VKQTFHNAIPRERLFVGKDREGRFMIMKTSPLPQMAVEMSVRSHGFEEAFFLDQGNKARFIVPGRLEDRPRYNLPYMLRVSDLDTAPIEYEAPPLDEYTIHARKRRKLSTATSSVQASESQNARRRPDARPFPVREPRMPEDAIPPSLPPVDSPAETTPQEPSVQDEPLTDVPAPQDVAEPRDVAPLD